NLASRLEGANKAYGTYIMISEDTRAKAGDDFETRQLDRVLVLGKRQPIAVYELLSRRGEIPEKTREALKVYGDAIELYYPGTRFGEAMRRLEKVLELWPGD